MQETSSLAEILWMAGVIGGPVALAGAMIYGIMRRRRNGPRRSAGKE
ncbi:MAG: hypothetical protein J0I45_11235 [Bosea sp.]|jgi:hypothetical protein|nr:hypothetical protein [Bosea sp. (in: a-proteobacteria)]